MEVAILTKDKYLLRKIQLELRGIAKVSQYSEGARFDVLLYDADTEMLPNAFYGQIIRMSRNAENGTFLIPYLSESLISALMKDSEHVRLRLDDGERCAILDGKHIKLTSLEYKLLSLLVMRGGEFVSRDEISKSVWTDASDGLINIYIHYLREKLERNGEKIILSSRKYGYKIDGKYIGGAVC